MANFLERTQAFEKSAQKAFPFLPGKSTKLQRALSASNRGALMEGQDIYLGVCNLERFLELKGIKDFRYQTCFRFIPDDEVHLLISIREGVGHMRRRLAVLADEAKKHRARKINNNVRIFLAKDGNIYLDNEFRDVLPPLGEIGPAIPISRLDHALWSRDIKQAGLSAPEFVKFVSEAVGMKVSHCLAPWGTND